MHNVSQAKIADTYQTLLQRLIKLKKDFYAKIDVAARQKDETEIEVVKNKISKVDSHN